MRKCRLPREWHAAQFALYVARFLKHCLHMRQVIHVSHRFCETLYRLTVLHITAVQSRVVPLSAIPSANYGFRAVHADSRGHERYGMYVGAVLHNRTYLRSPLG